MTFYFDCDVFLREAESLGLALGDEKLVMFNEYARLLVEWNERMNLTAVCDPYGIAVKHFADSLTLLKSVEIPQNGSLADIGTGAGFPGIPAKIMRPDIRLTLVDSLKKRLDFLEEVVASLGLENVKTVHLRAEDGGRDIKYRDRFDTVTARAVASYPKLCEYCIPFVKPGGYFAALKGPLAKDELSLGLNAVRLLGGEKPEICNFTLADDITRGVIVTKKIKATPREYPRKGALIAKKTL